MEISISLLPILPPPPAPPTKLYSLLVRDETLTDELADEHVLFHNRLHQGPASTQQEMAERGEK